MKTIHDFYHKKQQQQKISMVTCYDYTSAKIIDQSHIDCVLVGDSLAMVMHGAPDTTHATLDMMVMHTKAVRNGLKQKLLVSDLPFLSYRQDFGTSVKAVMDLIQAGANAVKLEGAAGNICLIKHLTESGVPVMGHLGLTPQHIHSMGLKIQGRDHQAFERLLQEARDLQAAGCFALVLECVPGTLAAQITQALDIATIGIGAGRATDGQILVWQDLLGMDTSFKPKFLKHFLNGQEPIQNSINQYAADVINHDFPSPEYSYHMPTTGEQ